MRARKHRKEAIRDLTAADWSAEKIAAALGLTLRTVRNHRAAIRRRADEARSGCERFRAEMEAAL